MAPSDVVLALGRERCAAILRTADARRAAPAMEAVIRAGFRVVEFTLNTPGAIDLIHDFSARPDLVVGAGTVLRPEDARAAVAAGARFLVSPVTDPEIIALALDLGVVPIPGTSTPTEMWQATRAGAPVVKLFPAGEKGPDWVRACLAPMPSLRIVPTAGVTEGNAEAFLRAGAFAVGFGPPLFDTADMSAGAFDRIEERARRLLARVAAAD